MSQPVVMMLFLLHIVRASSKVWYSQNTAVKQNLGGWHWAGNNGLEVRKEVKAAKHEAIGGSPRMAERHRISSSVSVFCGSVVWL